MPVGALLRRRSAVEFYERLKAWSMEPVNGVFLDDGEIAALEAFLGTLSFGSGAAVVETE